METEDDGFAHSERLRRSPALLLLLIAQISLEVPCSQAILYSLFLSPFSMTIFFPSKTKTNHRHHHQQQIFLRYFDHFGFVWEHWGQVSQTRAGTGELSVSGDTRETNTRHDSQACHLCTLARKHPNAHSEPWKRACGFRSWKEVRRQRARSLGRSAPRGQRRRRWPADGDRGPRGVSVRTDSREARAGVTHPGGLPAAPGCGGA